MCKYIAFGRNARNTTNMNIRARTPWLIKKASTTKITDAIIMLFFKDLGLT
jgi:hypothetical protein